MTTKSNPSGWSHRIWIMGFSVTGVAIAGYLTAVQLHRFSRAWDPIFGLGSERVLFSSFSRSLPLPDASIGASAYLLESLLTLFGSTDRWRRHPNAVLFSGVLIAGMGIGSVGLIGLQAFVVHAWCFLCLMSAGLSWTLCVLATPEVVKSWNAKYGQKEFSEARGDDARFHM